MHRHDNAKPTKLVMPAYFLTLGECAYITKGVAKDAQMCSENF